ncbi:MAG TPA: hypothetical protein VGM57_10010 [Pseudolabrys sp.]
MRARFAICLGLFATMAAPAFAQTEAPPAVVAKPAPLSAADLAFGRNIALIRGHLLTGDELAAQRDWSGAATHFSFPREEVYGLIRADVRAYKVPPFDDALRTLVGAAKARNAKALPKARQKVEAALNAVDAALKAKQQSWPRFTVAVAISLLKTAPDEYDDAVVKGRVLRPIGYQTARGYVLQTERMIQSVAGEFPGDNAVALSDISSGFAELKAAQPSVNAPKLATIDDAAFQTAVAKIDAAAAKLP